MSQLLQASNDPLEWIPMEIYEPEDGGYSRLMRKFKRDPIIPLGLLGTVGALAFGLSCFVRKDSQKSQMMMRARIAAQGITIAAIVISTLSVSREAEGNNRNDAVKTTPTT